MSIWRQFRRATARKTGKEWGGAERQFRMLADGGYEACHPRKGWRRFSARRLRAQARLHAMAERIAARRSV